MTQFRNVLLAEFYKNNDSKVVYLSILVPIIITMIAFYQLYGDIDSILISGTNPWLKISIIILPYYSIIFPALSIFIPFIFMNIEHRNNGFKLYLIHSIPKKHIFHSTLIVIFFWYSVSLILGFFLIYVLGALVTMISGTPLFFDYNFFGLILPYFFSLFFCGLLFSMFHYFLNSLRDDIVFSTLIPLFLVFAGFFISSSKTFIYLPYSYPSKALRDITSGTSFLSRDYIRITVLLLFILYISLRLSLRYSSRIIKNYND